MLSGDNNAEYTTIIVNVSGLLTRVEHAGYSIFFFFRPGHATARVRLHTSLDDNNDCRPERHRSSDNKRMTAGDTWTIPRGSPARGAFCCSPAESRVALPPPARQSRKSYTRRVMFSLYRSPRPIRLRQRESFAESLAFLRKTKR